MRPPTPAEIAAGFEDALARHGLVRESEERGTMAKSIEPSEAKSIGIELPNGYARMWSGPDCRRWVAGMAYDQLVKIIWSGAANDCIRATKEHAVEVFRGITLDQRRRRLVALVAACDEAAKHRPL